jgi:hypothetical protein
VANWRATASIPKVPDLQHSREKQKKLRQNTKKTITHGMVKLLDYSPWDDGDLFSIVGDLQQVVEISHDFLKGIRHEVQGSIGKNDRIFLVLSKVLFGDHTVIESGR